MLNNIVAFYSQMLRIREMEESFLKIYSKGLIRGTVHTCIGQEACAVGLINAIDIEKDIIFSNHRAHGHFIAYSNLIKELVAEVLGESTGICGGLGGTQHLHYKNMYTNGIQGGLVPIAVGSALAEKKKNSGAITLVFLGDGTMGQGVVYESFNISATWGLPILFVLENNKYAQSTPVESTHSTDFIQRASSFGLKVYSEDGNDVEKVYKRSLEAVNYVRNYEKPSFIMFDTYRLGPHSKGEDFRSEKELDFHRKKDPLLIARDRICEIERKKMEYEIKIEINNIFQNLIKKEY